MLDLVDIESIVLENCNSEGRGKECPKRIAKAIYNKLTSFEYPKIGDTLYKICPKCNPDHLLNCKNCAWGSAIQSYGCDVGVGVYSDGSMHKGKLQLIEVKFHKSNIFAVYDNLGTMYFTSYDLAVKALADYEEVRLISDKEQRIEAYKEYIRVHKIKNPLCKEI